MTPEHGPHADPQTDDLVRRLRVWSSAAWGHGDRLRVARTALQELADAAADAASRERSTVPQLHPSAIGDQVAVLAAQAAADGADPGPIVQRLTDDLHLPR